MINRTAPSLRNDAPRRLLDGFGRAITVPCRYEKPSCLAELADLLAQAKREGLTVTFRGNGQSYGDAALNTRGIVIDVSGLNRIVRWDPSTGLLEAEAGVTIEQLWQHVIVDGYWPAVVPGTMHATLGGCIAMNVHGKNNSRHGPFGDHVQSFELLTASGELLTCSREERPKLFFATIGGLGLLGAVVRLTLKLRRVHSGRLRVFATTARNLDESLERFESLLPKHDYVVGWVDAFARGSNLGRSEIHAASHLTPLEDPKGAASLNVAAQSLPTTLWGLPRAEVWRFMRPFANRPGMTLVNAVKFNLARIVRERTYLQSHAAFAFLLDYIPDWRLAYGDGGFIQHQLFVPYHCANRCIKQVLLTCQKAEIIPYLAVLKRHRPDPFLLSHALDGWSLALDFRITESTRTAVWDVTKRLTAQVLDVNGKFYFAKDAVLTPEDVERAYGHDRVKQFLVLKRDIDPTGLFGSDLSERVFATQTR